MKRLPHIQIENRIHTLYVDDKPFVALAGEIHNSSASSLEYMKEKVWPNLRDLNLNTVVVPVSWELVDSLSWNSFSVIPRKTSSWPRNFSSTS